MSSGGGAPNVPATSEQIEAFGEMMERERRKGQQSVNARRKEEKRRLRKQRRRGRGERGRRLRDGTPAQEADDGEEDEDEDEDEEEAQMDVDAEHGASNGGPATTAAAAGGGAAADAEGKGEEDPSIADAEIVHEYWSLVSDPVTLSRFLTANSCDMVAARQMLVAHLRWRKDNNIDSILEEDFAELERLRIIQWKGQDNLGHPVLLLRPAKHHPERYTVEQTCRFVSYMIEKGLHMYNTTQFVSMIDCRGLSRKNLDMKLLKAVAPVIELNYPERQYAAYVLPVGTVVMFVWKLARGFLDPGTVFKFRLTSTFDDPVVTDNFHPSIVERYRRGEEDDIEEDQLLLQQQQQQEEQQQQQQQQQQQDVSMTAHDQGEAYGEDDYTNTSATASADGEQQEWRQQQEQGYEEGAEDVGTEEPYSDQSGSPVRRSRSPGRRGKRGAGQRSKQQRRATRQQRSQHGDNMPIDQDQRQDARRRRRKRSPKAPAGVVEEYSDDAEGEEVSEGAYTPTPVASSPPDRLYADMPTWSRYYGKDAEGRVSAQLTAPCPALEGQVFKRRSPYQLMLLASASTAMPADEMRQWKYRYAKLFFRARRHRSALCLYKSAGDRTSVKLFYLLPNTTASPLPVDTAGVYALEVDFEQSHKGQQNQSLASNDPLKDGQQQHHRHDGRAVAPGLDDPESSASSGSSTTRHSGRRPSNQLPLVLACKSSHERDEWMQHINAAAQIEAEWAKSRSDSAAQQKSHRRGQDEAEEADEGSRVKALNAVKGGYSDGEDELAIAEQQAAEGDDDLVLLGDEIAGGGGAEAAVDSKMQAESTAGTKAGAKADAKLNGSAARAHKSVPVLPVADADDVGVAGAGVPDLHVHEDWDLVHEELASFRQLFGAMDAALVETCENFATVYEQLQALLQFAERLGFAHLLRASKRASKAASVNPALVDAYRMYRHSQRQLSVASGNSPTDAAAAAEPHSGREQRPFPINAPYVSGRELWARVLPRMRKRGLIGQAEQEQQPSPASREATPPLPGSATAIAELGDGEANSVDLASTQRELATSRRTEAVLGGRVAAEGRPRRSVKQGKRKNSFLKRLSIRRGRSAEPPPTPTGALGSTELAGLGGPGSADMEVASAASAITGTETLDADYSLAAGGGAQTPLHREIERLRRTFTHAEHLRVQQRAALRALALELKQSYQQQALLRRAVSTHSSAAAMWEDLYSSTREDAEAQIWELRQEIAVLRAGNALDATGALVSRGRHAVSGAGTGKSNTQKHAAAGGGGHSGFARWFGRGGAKQQLDAPSATVSGGGATTAVDAVELELETEVDGVTVLNRGKVWVSPARSPLVVSDTLFQAIHKLFTEAETMREQQKEEERARAAATAGAASPTGGGGGSTNGEADAPDTPPATADNWTVEVAHSDEFKEVCLDTAELQRVDLEDMADEDAMHRFLLTTYNLLCMHASASLAVPISDITGSMKDTVGYDIGGRIYTVTDLCKLVR